MSSMEFGIKHYAGQVWYNVEGFLEKNRDTLRYDVMDLLVGSRDKTISKMFLDLRNAQETAASHYSPASAQSRRRAKDGQFVTMKPRAPTVAARFQDALQQVVRV
jgi:myosin-15